jgi:hypothetical protein
VKKEAIGKQRGGKGRATALRRVTIVTKARVLLEWAGLSPETHLINLVRLPTKRRVSSQAFYDNDLDEESDRYKKLQRKTSLTSIYPKVKSATNSNDHPQEIAQEEISSMPHQRNSHLERSRFRFLPIKTARWRRRLAALAARRIRWPYQPLRLAQLSESGPWFSF